MNNILCTFINLFFIISILYNTIRTWNNFINIFINILHIIYIVYTLLNLINNMFDFSNDININTEDYDNIHNDYNYYAILLMNE